MGKQSRERKAKSQVGERAFLAGLRPFHRLLAMCSLEPNVWPDRKMSQILYFADAPIFDIKGIDKFADAYRTGEREYLHESIGRFGRVVAPFPKTVLEFRLDGFDADWVVLVSCLRYDEEHPGYEFVEWNDGDGGDREAPSWVMNVERFVLSKRDERLHVDLTRLGLSLYLSDDGVCDGFDFYNQESLAPIDDILAYPGYLFSEISASLSCAAFALMTSPDVIAVDQEPNWKKNEEFKRITGKSLTRYKILTIKHERLQYVSDKTKSEFQDIMALHDVRAHWRNSLSHPIPQFRRVMFIPSHQRGSEKNGIVVKDYKVKP